MGEINNKPQLFVVAQAGTYLQAKDEQYQKKYQAVCDHLFATIQLDGRLEVKIETVNESNKFNAYVDSLRDSHVDKDRPFAFLFIAPEQYDRKANEELENTIKEISNATRGENGDKKVIASSVIFVNNETENEAIEFKDHSKTLNALAKVDDNLLKQIQKKWTEFTHYSLKTKTGKLKSQIEAYLKGLNDHIIQDTDQIKPLTKSEARIMVLKKESRDCKYSKLTIKDLKKEQQEKIKSIDWKEAQRISKDKKKRKSRYPTMQLVKEGQTYGEIAKQLDIQPASVFKIVNDFLLYTDDFMKGVDQDAVTETKD